jgi:hypothetical protein
MPAVETDHDLDRVCVVPIAQRGRDQQIGEAAVEAHGRNYSDASFARRDIVLIEHRARTRLLGGDVKIVDAGSQGSAGYGVGRFKKRTSAIDDGPGSIERPIE